MHTTITRIILAITAAFILAVTGCATTTQPDGGNPARIESPTPKATTGQQQATIAAQGYIDGMPMSPKGLRSQLAFEKHTRADIDYAMKHLTVDWQAEAIEAAQGYMDTLPMSKAGLVEQLTFDGFSKKQATTAANTVWGDK